jgi:hypothetical protein
MRVLLSSSRRRSARAGRRRAVGLGATIALVGAGLMVGAQPAFAAPDECEYGRVICISKDTRTLRLMVNGESRIRMSVRFGSHRTPTREGTFRIEWKDAEHVSSLYHSAMPFSLFFDDGQAIHYSEDFARNGYSGASHGCVNVRDYDAMDDLYNSVWEGTRVVIY